MSRETHSAIEPVWPLPRRPEGLSDNEIRAAFGEFELWHYAYSFGEKLTFRAKHRNPDALSESSERHLQRFRHFMPGLIEDQGGSLEGKRIFDIACNSGFWSVQCALLGAAEVVGFDSRPVLIDQANLKK